MEKGLCYNKNLSPVCIHTSYAVFRVVYREYPTRDLIFLCIHTRLKARGYTCIKKNQVTRGIFYGIPLESIA